MKRKPLMLGSLALVALVVSALWVSRSRAPGDAAAALAPAPASAPGPAAPASQKPEPARSGAEPAGPQRASASHESEPIPRKPTLGLAQQPASPPPTPEELERLGPSIEPYQKAWEKHIAPLLYPRGHPLEGTYLDTVTLDQAVEAQLRYYEEISPPGYLDKPRLRIEKSFNYRELNERAKTWDRTDLASTREFYDWMVAQPEDPTGRWGDIWVDAAPSDKDAITRREFLRQRILAREAPIFP